jgi:hypothetical protein
MTNAFPAAFAAGADLTEVLRSLPNVLVGRADLFE